MYTRILAGPWVGEFGWELFCWQGHLRWKAQMLGEEIIVISRKGHELLYQDFCNEFIAIDANYDHANMWANDDYPQHYFYGSFSGLDYEGHLLPQDLFNCENQKFIKFGFENQRKSYICVHARSTSKFNTAYRNWPVINWKYLMLNYPDLSFIFIGHKEDSYCSEDHHQALDYRGIDLKHLAEIISNATMVIGPSSGPMHFASLCGTPHVVWYDNNVAIVDNGERYKKLWNPLKTKVELIKTWQPAVKQVIEAMEKLL